MSKEFHVHSIIAALLLLTSCHAPTIKPDHLTSLRAKYAVSFNIDGCDYGEPTFLDYVIKGWELNKLTFLLEAFWPLASLKSLANTTVLPTFFASPAAKIHQSKKRTLFISHP